MEVSSKEKRKAYILSLQQVEEVLKDESDAVAIMASVACILKTNLPYAFWAGFYRVDRQRADELVIGPYQGTMGCLRIPFSKGVCGYCARSKETVIVGDVHQFAGHIACDSQSQSEIVVPVFDSQRQLYAVLDIDSVELNSFSEDDKIGLEMITRAMTKKL